MVARVRLCLRHGRGSNGRRVVSRGAVAHPPFYLPVLCPPQFIKEMADKFNLILVDTLKGEYPMVAQPVPTWRGSVSRSQGSNRADLR
jgi:hypothetical protein